MVQTANTLVPVNPKDLMSIDPLNWRRYPSVPITKAMTDRAYIPPIVFTPGNPDDGSNSDNDGETGTMSVAYNSDAPYADNGFYGPRTQKAKSQLPNLTAGTIIAPDVGKSYALDGTKRGTIEPDQPYPTTVIPTTVTPPAFLPSNYIPPVQGP